MDFTTLFTLLYNLWVSYTFGNLQLAGIALFLILAYIGYKSHLSADGWVVLFGGAGAVLGYIFFADIALPIVIFIGIAFIIYLAARRFFGGR